MKSRTTRKYTSPVRESRANETREAILSAVAEWLQDDAHGDFTFDDIARKAGLERRTIFRHFESKEVLLETFWKWINYRLAPTTLPESLEELVLGPSRVFPMFDEAEGLVRGSLHNRAGRAMRMAAVPSRREAFRLALRTSTLGASEEDLQRLEVVAHALYSAAAWETMRDYAGVSGAEAGEAASWALQILLEAIRKSENAPHQDD